MYRNTHITETEMLKAIKIYAKAHGYMPCVKEIANALDVCETTAYYCFIAMLEDGTLETDGELGSSRKRAYRVPGLTYKEN